MHKELLKQFQKRIPVSHNTQATPKLWLSLMPQKEELNREIFTRAQS
jgi:hypothetical protein